MQKRRAGQACCVLRNLKLLVGIGCLEFQKGMAGMDSSNKYVPQISFGTASHLANMGNRKAAPPPCSSHMGPQSVYCNKSSRPQLLDQTLSAWDRFFPSAATKGWAWCKQKAELVEHTTALRNLKLLVGSGCLELQKGMTGMDSCNKHVVTCLTNFVWHCVTCCEHRQPKGSQPLFQPTG